MGVINVNAGPCESLKNPPYASGSSNQGHTVTANCYCAERGLSHLISLFTPFWVIDMKKITKIAFLTNLLLTANVVQPVSAADILQVVLWAYPSNTGTTTSYEIDWAGLEYDLPSVSQWSWGRPLVQAVDCRVGVGTGSFNQVDYNVVAFPQKVQIIPGFDAIISVLGDYDNGSTDGWNISLGHKKTWSIPGNSTISAACATNGASWTGPYENGSSAGISQRIRFPLGIPAGSYNIQIPARVGLYSRYWSNNHTPLSIAPSLMFSYLAPVETRVSINVQVNNSCEFNVNNLTLDHRTQILGVADKHEVVKPINVSCTGETGVRLSLVSLSPPNQSVPGEYRAGLGNGWDSRLKLNDVSGPLDLQFLAAGSQTVRISSELVRGPSSDVGRLSGSAVLVMAPN